ncbi:unnamed protein product [Phytophthora lilii]|uniref:Unnamed protein product n=1 Tax=Phytophthora lilii TaxID=2077276 RepID=A0A9W6TN94_9STRA|nr:unnamed protein product [Phytophthora lilii]
MSHLERLKDLWRKYGVVAIGTYLTMYGAVLGSMYLAIDQGWVRTNKRTSSKGEGQSDESFNLVTTTNKWGFNVVAKMESPRELQDRHVLAGVDRDQVHGAGEAGADHRRDAEDRALLGTSAQAAAQSPARHYDEDEAGGEEAVEGCESSELASGELSADAHAPAASEAASQSLAVVTLKNFVSGTMGGGCEAVVGYPLETVKARMQTQQSGAKAFSGPLDCLRKSLQEGGVTSLYRGASPQIFRSAMRYRDIVLDVEL